MKPQAHHAVKPGELSGKSLHWWFLAPISCQRRASAHSPLLLLGSRKQTLGPKFHISSSAGFRHDHRAFTLLEILGALVLIGIAAALLAPVWISGIRMGVAGSARVEAIHALNAEMEEWVYTVRETHTDAFDSLDDLTTTHFSARPNITLTENQWIEFSNLGGGSFQEAVSAGVSDHLRITIQHTDGGDLTYLFTRPTP